MHYLNMLFFLKNKTIKLDVSVTYLVDETVVSDRSRLYLSCRRNTNQVESPLT